MENNIQSNIKKYFYYLLTQRRNFDPIISIYFLSLPNTTANQIGLYTGFGFLFSFLFQIPSSYFADNFGHKKTLILSKIFLICSTSLYIIGSFFNNSFVFFVFASIFASLGFAFTEGVGTAFFHETLMSLGKDKDFSKIYGKLKGNVSLASIILILLFPFSTNISMIFPFYMALVIDIIGIFIAFTLVNPKGKQVKIAKENQKSIKKLILEMKHLGLYSFSIFTGAIVGLNIASTSFRNVYLQDLGYPVIFIGFVMGLSRFFWFIFGHYAHYLQKIMTMKQFFILDMLVFVGGFFLAVILDNPYIVGLLFSIVVGYLWGRGPVVQHYLLTNYKIDNNYKASILSINGQFSSIFQIIGSFGIGYFMSQSFKLGFFVFGVTLFFILITSYYFIYKRD
ncbi:MAG: MFS transporter [Candidatus Gracilibacteria bacterium]|nr:MFS transporter [Candidatus Gracilibacteria bacterium]